MSRSSPKPPCAEPHFVANHPRFVAEMTTARTRCVCNPGVQLRSRADEHCPHRRARVKTDGYLKSRKIASVRRPTTEEFMSGMMGWR